MLLRVSGSTFLPPYLVLIFVFPVTLSFPKLILDCWSTGDWGGIRGYPVKFAIGLVSVFFDIIFLLQVRFSVVTRYCDEYCGNSPV